MGVGTSNGDLIQSIADNWQSSRWSVFAYKLLKTGVDSQVPVRGRSVAAEAGERVTMHCGLFVFFSFGVLY